MPTPTAEAVQLVFPFVAVDYQPALAAAVLRALIFVFVTLFVHSLHGLVMEWRGREILQQTEDLLILMLFCGFHFLLILLPDRTDLPAATFGLWFFLFFVRSLLRAIITIQE